MSSVNTYRFSSKEWLLNANLYYYGYRFYDPNLQRWLNRDPLEEYGGINLYGYVDNRPEGEIDPYGLAESPPISGIPENPQYKLILPPTNKPPVLVPPPGGGAGAPGGMPPGSTGAGNMPVIKPIPCIVGNTRKVTNSPFTCPCTMTTVQCELGEICQYTGFLVPSRGVNGPPTRLTAWVPYRNCGACPEGQY